ncbi:MAG: hypothetical protein QM610_06580 [Chitinophagaceae bacterium]
MKKVKIASLILVILLKVNISIAQPKDVIRQIYTMVLDTLWKDYQKNGDTLFSFTHTLIINCHTQNFNVIYGPGHYDDVLLGGGLMKGRINEQEYPYLRNALQNRTEIVIDTSIIETRNGMLDISCEQGVRFFKYKPNNRHFELSNPIFIGNHCIISFAYGREREEYAETWWLTKNGNAWEIPPSNQRFIMNLIY